MGAPVKPIRSGQRVPIGATKTRKYKSPVDKAKGYEIVWNQVSYMFEAARTIIDASFVYVIGEDDNGPIKIGVSKDPIARLRTMQTGNPRRLRIEYLLLGDTHIEKLLHELWEPFAIYSSRTAGKPGAAPGTEWFKPDVRETLTPILLTAVDAQLEYLHSGEPLTLGELERCVRDAHIAHDFVAQGRDQVLLLAAGAGYVSLTRPSRI